MSFAPRSPHFARSGKVMRAHRDEMRELKIEVAKLGSEIAELRAALAEARARARGVDPAAVARRVN
jgi:hypothetical protein